MNATLSFRGRPDGMKPVLEASTQVVALDFSSGRPAEVGPVVVSTLALLDESSTHQFDTGLSLSCEASVEPPSPSTQTQRLVARVKDDRVRQALVVLAMALLLGWGLAVVISAALDTSAGDSSIHTGEREQPAARVPAMKPLAPLSLPQPPASPRRSAFNDGALLLERRE